MFLRITSTNPNFSYLIGKHPDNECVKPVRPGMATGWWHEGAYCIHFKDNGLSYPRHSYETVNYLDRNCYLSPLCVMNLLTEFLRPVEKFDVDAFHTIEFNIQLKEKTIDMITRFFQDVELIRFRYNANNIEFTYRQQGKFTDFISFIDLLLFLAALENREGIFLTDELIAKYVKKAVNISAPYWLRYMIKKFCLRDQHRWNTFGKTLEFPGEDFTPYTNLEARMRFIQDHLTGNPVIDIGCGEGNYLFLAKTRPYYGYDPDLRVLETARAKAENYDNAKLYQDMNFLDELDKTIPYDIVISEVIEHIYYSADFKDSLYCILEKLPLSRIICTTPNKDFNQFYKINKRHPDHRKEYNKETLIEFFKYIKPPMIYDIGDKIVGIATTLGAIV